MWNETVANIKDFFNQPVPIIGCSILFLIVFFLVIFSKTSLGKKTLKKILSGFIEVKTTFGIYKEVVDSKVKEIEQKTKDEVQKMEEKIALQEELIEIIVNNTHNEQIKAKYLEYKEKLDKVQTDVDSLINEKVEEEKTKFEAKAKEEIDNFYETYLKDVKVKIEELVAKAEKVAETTENQAKTTIEEIKEVIEDEERTDTNSTEETL